MSEYTTAGFGATINGKHTWKDYGLVIGNTDIVSEPSPKTNYIEVPGSSIRIDLTETLTGQVEYESRQLKFSLGKMEREDLWPVHTRFGCLVRLTIGEQQFVTVSGTVTLAEPVRAQWLLASPAKPEAVQWEQLLSRSDHYQWMQGGEAVYASLSLRPSGGWRAE